MKKLTLILSLLFVLVSCNNEASDSSNSVVLTHEEIKAESVPFYDNSISHIYYGNIHYIRFSTHWINYTKDSFEFEEMMRKQVNSNLFENHSSLSLISDSVVTMMPLQK